MIAVGLGHKPSIVNVKVNGKADYNSKKQINHHVSGIKSYWQMQYHKAPCQTRRGKASQVVEKYKHCKNKST